MRIMVRAGVRTSIRLAAIAALAASTLAAASAQTTPDRGTVALGRLAAKDLDVGTPGGKAFLGVIGGTNSCAPPNGPLPGFERLCSWSATNADDDFDMMVGINDNRIVSVLTSWPRQLPAATWSCEAFAPDSDGPGLSICSVKSASVQDRAHWAKGWRDYLNSVS
ncbi:hypothetical protein TPR58_06520 [Sphingomonas sp. HF-S3]|uniref:Secreted protein n=1 Tax=Sphingomonas rustica TaxID=3103142 RepID=A0ABV0B6I0_9SPHN